MKPSSFLRAKAVGRLALCVLVASALCLAGSCQANPAIGGDVYGLTISVVTQSDWTHVRLDGPFDLFLLKGEVTEGSDAPELSVRKSSRFVDVHKTQYDTTRVGLRLTYLLRGATASDGLTVTIGRGHLEWTRVTVHAFDLRNTIEVGEAFHDQIFPLKENIFNEASFQIGLGGLSSIEPLRNVKIVEGLDERLILAFYYPWYGTPRGPSGRWFHWEGVTENSIASSTNYPLLGAYDSNDEALLRSHMELAKSAGVDGFVFSWWGIGSFEDEALEAAVEVAEEVGFQLSIYYESVRDISASQIEEELQYILSTYASSTAFLRILGRPAIFIYAVSAYGRSPEDWAGILERVERGAGIQATFIGDTFDLEYLPSFDGLHTYNPIWITDYEAEYLSMSENLGDYVPDGEELLERILAGEQVEVHVGGIFCASVAPGYDDTKIRTPGLRISRAHGEYYTRGWEGVFASEAPVVLITTWNEWHEGTEIEPSREYGFQYISLTRDFAERYKGIRLPVPPNPRLEVEVTPFTARVEAGEILNLLVMVHNREAAPSYATTLSVSIPEGLQLLLSQPAPHVSQPREITFSVPMVPPDGHFEAEIQLRSVDEGTHAITMDIGGYYDLEGDFFDPPATTVDVTVGRPILSIAVAATAAGAAGGIAVGAGIAAATPRSSLARSVPAIEGMVESEIEELIKKARCPWCGRMVKRGSKYCPHCGSVLEGSRTCAECNSALPSNARFCPKCGTSIGGGD